MDQNAREEMALHLRADIAYYKLLLSACEAGLLEIKTNSHEYAEKDAEIKGIKIQISALESKLASL